MKKAAKKQKVMVTGGAGYIGSILVPALLREGFRVQVLDNFMYGQAPLLDCCAHPDFTVERGDARDERLVKEGLKDADWIIPLACLTGAPLCDRNPAEAKGVILDALDVILKYRAPAQALLYPTTNSGYGIGRKGRYCTEKTPLRPVSLYGRLKNAAEEKLLAAGNSATFRLATAFGVSPRMRLDLLVNDFAFRAFNDRFVVLFEAHFKRNFIHVRDVARAFRHAMKNWRRMSGETYNLGLSDANLSKLELCRAIKKRVPEFYFYESPIGEDPDKRDYIVSNAKIEATGFRPEFSLDRGIAELLKSFRIIRRDRYSNV
ncbi:MAG: NAD-dependent epimerase/dehydratase [Elusimicrobia bacterium]|nr:MAG: NAD-dependent epimerase/dehydratase [Elusimicrobiota bacterium]KAF0153733.1 MAG: NAD-dependent epimerase/dehydratase [Elusimicrobiota bacterium]